MSDQLIANLNRRVEELTTENASLKAENKDRRVKTKKVNDQLEDLKKQLGTLTTERDDLKSKVDAKPGELQAKIDELQGQIRSRDHRDAFASVKEFEVAGQDGKTKKYTLRDGVTTDAVWKQLDYKADGATPDAKAVSAKYADAIKSHGYLFAEATTPADAGKRPITVQSREAGPGGGKGDSPTVTSARAGDQIQTVNKSGRPVGAF